MAAKRTGRHSGTGKPGGAYCAVMGSASPQDLVQAVEKAGYARKRLKMTRNAVSANRKPPLYDEALPLAGNCRTGGGYPGEVWGMIGDNMMVTADNRSLWWLSA